MVLTFMLGPAVLVIRHLAGTAAQFVLAVLADFAGAFLPPRIDQHVLIKFQAAECLQALCALVLLVYTPLTRLEASLSAVRAQNISL